MPEYDFEVTTLYDQDVTRQRVKQELDALTRNELDFFVFYFAGHGTTLDIGTFLVTSDYSKFEPGIELDYLSKVIQVKLQKSTSVVIILDCCHSGEASLPQRDLLATRAITEDGIKKSLPNLGNGKVILAACQSHETSLEIPSLKHGIFTYHLIHGLMGEAVDDIGEVTIPRLHDYISFHMMKSINQQPVYKGDLSGRIVIGAGLDPKKGTKLEDVSLEQLEKDAKQYVEDYFINNTTNDFDYWKLTGHKYACISLAPIIDWLDRQSIKHPALLRKTEFKNAYDSAYLRLQQLATYDNGTTTEKGIIEKSIGTGTFGTVYLIETSDSEKKLAYKVYHPQDIKIKDKISRFERGYDAMKQLDHPYIVKVGEYTNCPIGFYMDYIPGPNLRDFTGTSNEPLVQLTILKNIADTLLHAHGRNIIHRDVKPENIIMRYDEKSLEWLPYLSDFDLAWFSTATKLTKDALGTVFYAAPEQLAKPTSSQAHAKTTDVFSFGQLCYFVVCNTDPVPMGMANNWIALQERLNKWGREKAARLFLDLYKKCTEQNPENRPQDFIVINEMLLSIIEYLRSDSIKNGDNFVEELIYSIVGLTPGRKRGNCVFSSLSDRVEIQVYLTKQYQNALDMVLTFILKEKPAFQGHDFAQAYDIMLSRIRDIVNPLNFARVQPGSHRPIEFKIILSRIEIDFTGIEKCHRIITRTIDAIERI